MRLRRPLRERRGRQRQTSTDSDARTSASTDSDAITGFSDSTDTGTDADTSGGCGGGCACGGHSAGDTSSDAGADTSSAAQAGAIREQYLVDGMTCGHCVSSVTEEVSAIEGVDSVSVDLNAGGTSKIMVVSSVPVSEQAVRDAVTEAGYSLADA